MPSPTPRRASRAVSALVAGVLAVALAAATASCGAGPASPSTSVSTPTLRPGASSVSVPPSASAAACTVPRAPDPVGWWDDRVFYEVFVRSFQDSDGDGIGDLRGLVERLDYLNDGDPTTTDDLGVTGIWLMPVAESPSYHGYDVVDYRAIEQDYGTAEDFRALVAAAEERGIAVIVDLVMNHTSRDHAWFQEARTPGSERDDWYVWADELPGYGGPDGQRVWHPDGDRFYYGLFWEGMPDLDLTHPDVTAELDAIARFWLDEMGVAGFRLDAIKHFVEEGQDQEGTPATHAWLEGFHDRLHETHADALLVGEVFDAAVASAAYVPDAVDLTFNFELAGKTLLAARTGDGSILQSAMAGGLERYEGDQFGAFLTNHDQPRVATTVQDPGALRAAASGLLTAPGVPFVYYGEEIGLPGNKPDERIRTPMPWEGGATAGFTSGTPWQPFEPGWDERNVAAQVADAASLLAHYRGLVHARNALPALRHGTWSSIDAGAPELYAFVAAAPEEAAVVVVNFADEATTDYALDLAGTGVCLPPTASVAYADGFDAAPVAVAPPGAGASPDSWRPVAELPPRSTLILKLAP